MRIFTEQEEQARRLREARTRRFATATEAWAHIKKYSKVSLAAYIQHENGNRGFKSRAAEYARALDVPAGWLLWKESAKAAEGIRFPVSGKVAAGSEGYFDSDYAPGDGSQTVEFDPETISLVLDIEGDSMLPRFRHGNKAFFGHKYDDPSPLIGQEIMAQLKDGRKLLKILQRGSIDGVWDLYSVNTAYDPIRDVVIQWALPLKWVKV